MIILEGEIMGESLNGLSVVISLVHLVPYVNYFSKYDNIDFCEERRLMYALFENKGSGSSFNKEVN
jgi:hypothetical protein